MNIASVVCVDAGKKRKRGRIVLLREYVEARLNEGETSAVIEGLHNNVRSTLDHAMNAIPSEDWNAEISNRQKEGDGQTLLWLTGRSEPSYSIQE